MVHKRTLATTIIKGQLTWIRCYCDTSCFLLIRIFLSPEKYTEYKKNICYKVYRIILLHLTMTQANKIGTDKENSVATIKEQIREAARVAEETSMSDDFNAMSWLDLLLEDNPETFDCFFDTNWNELSDDQRTERATVIRRVL